MDWLWIALAAFAGMGLPLQAAINNRLRTGIESSLWASVISFAGGFLVLVIVTLALRVPWPGAARFATVPWWAWLGGLCGAAFVTMTIVLVPKTGLAMFIVGLVAGQMLLSMLWDHYGWMGTPVRPITAMRALGAAVVVAGVVMVQRG